MTIDFEPKRMSKSTPNLIEAIRNKSVNTKTWGFTTNEGKCVDLLHALRIGLIKSEVVSAGGLSLSDCLNHGLVHAGMGKIIDRHSGKHLRIREAIEKGLINPHKLEIFNHKTMNRISLKQALDKGIVDDANGKYVSKRNRISFESAFAQHLIWNPLTLMECGDRNLFCESNGKIKDLVSGKAMDLLESIGNGFLDIESKSIRDVAEEEYVSLVEAIKRCIITKECRFKNTSSGDVVLLSKAIMNGHLTTVSIKSIFDVEGIRSSESGSEYMSLNKAIEIGLIEKNTGLFVDKKANTKLSLHEAANMNFIQSELVEMLCKLIGIFGFSDKSKELTIMQAVIKGHIDPNSGLLIDPLTKCTVPVEVALKKNLITQAGASLLQSLLKIIVTKATITQVVNKDSSNKFDVSMVNDDDDDNNNTNFSSSISQSISANISSANVRSRFDTPQTRRSLFARKSPKIFVSENNELVEEDIKEPINKDIMHEVDNIRMKTSIEDSATEAKTTKMSMENKKNFIAEHVGDKQNSKVLTENKSKAGVIHVQTGMKLNDAISAGYFDTSRGIIRIPNSKIVSSFKECVLDKVIDPESAIVIHNGKSFSLNNALEAKILDQYGRYKDHEIKITMDETIKKGIIEFVAVTKDAFDKEDKIKDNLGKNKISVLPKVIMNCIVAEGIQTKDIKVQDPKNQDEWINIDEAIQQSMINSKNGEYTSHTGQTIDFLKAIDEGYIVASSKVNPKDTLNASVKIAQRKSNMDIESKIVRNDVNTTKVSSFITESSNLGEEISFTVAANQKLTNEEITSLYKNKITKESEIKSTELVFKSSDTKVKTSVEEAVSCGIREMEPEQKFVNNDSPLATPLKPASSFIQTSTPFHQTKSPSFSNKILNIPNFPLVENYEKDAIKNEVISSSHVSDSFLHSGTIRSELSFNINKHSPNNNKNIEHEFINKLVYLKSGYALLNLEEVKNIVTGEKMSLYEAKLQGIASYVKQNNEEHIQKHPSFHINDALSKNLVDVVKNTFTNPIDGNKMSIVQAIKLGLLITDIEYADEGGYSSNLNIKIYDRPVSMNDALLHCFDKKSRKFKFEFNHESLNLTEAIEHNFINGNDLLFDTRTNTSMTIIEAIKQGKINRKTCYYTGLGSSDEPQCILAAARNGIIAIFPHMGSSTATKKDDSTAHSLKEIISNGLFNKDTGKFVDVASQKSMSLTQAVQSGWIESNSAEVKNTKTGQWYTLLNAINHGIINEDDFTFNDFVNSKKLSLDEAYDKKIIIDVEWDAPFECLSLWDAIERGQLNTNTGMFISIHLEKKALQLEEAVYRKYIDKKSALIKDTWKNKYCSLAEASRTHLIRDGHVMNTTTGHFLSIHEGIQQNVIVRKIWMISLIEILDFGMYDAYSGRLSIPGITGEVNLGNAIEMKVVDCKKGFVKSRNSNGYYSVEEAIKNGDIDVIAGMYGPLNLLEARTKGYILSGDALRAVQDKYQQTIENLDDLSKWIEKVEKQISKQDMISEDINGLKNQIKSMKHIKGDIEDHNRNVNNTMDMIAELTTTGSDVLSAADLNQIQQEGSRIKERYDCVNHVSDEILRGMKSSLEELQKYKFEVDQFNTWLKKAFSILSEKERQLAHLDLLQGNCEGIKEFVSDVVTHGADLKFLTMSGQKFVDISKEYVSCINEFRIKLRCSHIRETETQMSQEILSLKSSYQDLLNRANQLADSFAQIGSKSKDYNDAVEKAKQWLKDTEPKVSKICSEPIGAEPHVVEDQLNRARSLSNEIVTNSKLIDNAKQAAFNLLNSLDDRAMSQQEKRQIQQTSKELQNRYDSLVSEMAKRCAELDKALAQSQGVQDALNSIVQWLDHADSQMKNILKPASLIRERLDEQIRQIKVLQSEVNSHQPSIQSIYHASQEFVQSAKNVRESKKIETKVKDVQQKFQSILKTINLRADFFNEVSSDLSKFTENVHAFDEWYDGLIEMLDSREMISMNADQSSKKLEEIIRQKDQKRTEYESMIKHGKNMTSQKDVTDTIPCKDTIKEVERKWQELNDILNERQSHSRARRQSLNAYEALKQQVDSWLTKMEATLEKLDPIALELDILQRQNEEIKPINQEYISYGKTIDKINEIGLQYDSILKGNIDNNGSQIRRSSIAPRKSSFIPSHFGSRRMSSSPDKYGRATTPGTIRRESAFPVFHDISPIQAQLTDINNRYDMIGIIISDRQRDMSAMKEEIKMYQDNLKQLVNFLDKQEKSFPHDAIPSDKRDADKQLRIIKDIMDLLSDNQPLLDESRVGIKDLLRKNNNAPGANMLEKHLHLVVTKWKDFQDKCKEKSASLEELKMFLDIYANLDNWLNSKRRMMNVLGTIASDPRLVQNQMSQIAVMHEEFIEKLPQKDKLNEIGDSLLRIAGNTSNKRNIEEKVSHINKLWKQLLAQLEDKKRSLEALSGPTRDFLNLSNKLMDNLSKISDDLDDIPSSKADVEEKLKAINEIANHLNNQRPLLADICSIGDELQNILTDPASKSEIKSKLGQVERQFNICEKKLDHVFAQLENYARETKGFEQECNRVADMLHDFKSYFDKKLEVSADKNILAKQVAKHNPIYQEIMSKEHEIIMLLNKGREQLNSVSKDKKNRNKILDDIEKQWQMIKTNANNWQRRLNTSMEYCTKFNSRLQTFLPWLQKVEEKFYLLKAISFIKNELIQQEKELHSLRNDVNKHSTEFDSTYSSGFNFLDSCDIDKDAVESELAHIKDIWDKLNIDISNRGQTITDLLSKLNDFNDNISFVDNNLQRIEVKLAETDKCLNNTAALHTIQGLLSDIDGVHKQFSNVKRQGEVLIGDADSLGSNADNIADAIENLECRFDDAHRKLHKKADSLKNASTALSEFKQTLKELNNSIHSLEDEFNSMKPVARNIDYLHRQMDEINSFIKKLDSKRCEIDEFASMADDIISQGYTSNPNEIKNSIKELNGMLKKLDNLSSSRKNEIHDMTKKMQTFYESYTLVMQNIDEVVQKENRFASPGNDIETLKSQQVEYEKFQQRVVDVVGKEVDKVNKNGQSLIQSAANEVNTQKIEKDLEKMNDKWNHLKERIFDRQQKLEQSMLQSGKFKEALSGLLSWLAEMDEMIANQKPPSSDYKVVRAQIQEQRFVSKLLHDRKTAVNSLVNMSKDIIDFVDKAEKRRVENEIRDLEMRFSSLNEKCESRMILLEEALVLAKECHDKLRPLELWLDSVEKKIELWKYVPTDEHNINQRIKEHDQLHKEITNKEASFDDLADTATALIKIVGDDDAHALSEKIDEMNNRYNNLSLNSESMRNLLESCLSDLKHLVMSYEDLLAWIEKTEQKLLKYSVLSMFTEKLINQIEELDIINKDISSHEKNIDKVVKIANELMKNISNEEALQLRDKIDLIQRKYNNVATKFADILKNANELLPLVKNFHYSHNNLCEWMAAAESIIQSIDSHTLEDQEAEIICLEKEVEENRPILEGINTYGPKLSQNSSNDGAKTIEDLVIRDNKRFDSICEQVQKRGEKINFSKKRSNEIINDIDELLDWFREVENQLLEAESPSSEPEIISVQLKEHKALNDDVACQKGRVKDVLSNAKKVIREGAPTKETPIVKEKMDDLKETMDAVIKLSGDRLSILEQALPLAKHFFETHNEFTEWLDEMDREMLNQLPPGMRPDQIAKQQEINRSFIQSVHDHKPVLDRINKTGGALLRLVIDEDAYRVQEIIESDNQRYNSLKVSLRERQQDLEDAMQECSQFTEKLDGMLNALADTAEQIHNAEPISGHTERIKEQIEDNDAIMDDLDKKEAAYNAVKKSAAEIIQKAPNKNDPVIKDIKKKLDKLTGLWSQLQKSTKNRCDSLAKALTLAEKFWQELKKVMSLLNKIQNDLVNQPAPGVNPNKINDQKAELMEIKKDMDNAKPSLDKCKMIGNELIDVIGEPDKPELRRHVEDMNCAWENITALFYQREQNLLAAMEMAMEFHEILQTLMEFLDKSKRRFDNLEPIGTDIDQVKKQIREIGNFKNEVDPWMIKVEALNRYAANLVEKASPEQAKGIKEPMLQVNMQWDNLNKGIGKRQRDLEQALLRLGQFQHALNELLIWIDRTDKTLNTLKTIFGDPQNIEVELAKLKVMVNDIQAHQSSVDTLNDAGRRIIDAEKGSREASDTQGKLNELNMKWNNLLSKAECKQSELEDALREAQAYNQEVQDMLQWINDVDSAISSSKPLGGLPETANDQLEKFMEFFKELETTGPKVEALIGRGNEYLKKSKDGMATNLGNNLRTLKTRWENILVRANDKKIKLEIALKEAIEFHETLQTFISWLTNAEKSLSNLNPVSRVLETICDQIEQHKEFQAEVSSQREVMLSLDKKGTHLKYFSQKQDVILIKNLLVSVQHRWEKVVSKSAERTRALDYGYKEAKEFHSSWEFMCNWLDETAKNVGDVSPHNKNDPFKIKKEIEKNKEIQRELQAKQPMYDSTLKNGKQLKDKAPKSDEKVLREMLVELKNKWLNVSNMIMDKQKKLEEALLFSGQFKDAMKALLDWLCKMENSVDENVPVHGDLDTVIGLVEKHKHFEEELNGRNDHVESLKRTAEELLESADREDSIKISAQVTELTNQWEKVWTLSNKKTTKLEEALTQAELLHKSVNMLLEWLSDAEMKLRFSGPLPEDEAEVDHQLQEHEKFMFELKQREKDKDYTLDLARKILDKAHPDAVSIIKHWITIIQSRWEEVASWALQRAERLKDHKNMLKDLHALLDELMQWVIGKENVLIDLEQQTLPDDINEIKELIDEHQQFMDGLSVRQPEIDSVCKPMRQKSTAPSSRKQSRVSGKMPSRESFDETNDAEIPRRTSYGYGFDGRDDARDYPKPWLDFLHDQSRSSTFGVEGSSDDRRRASKFGDRKASRVSVVQEQGIKNPKAKELWDKWRNVWMMAWERDRRLKDKLSYIQELEKVKNFNWDGWRKRFLKHHNNKKSRVTDFLRKLDENDDGFIDRDSFVDGILRDRFMSSKLELNAVADKFDKGDGMIDWREFMAALRSDWDNRGPLTEAERIDDEIIRQVGLCTCQQKFKVLQVGEGRYRFGDSQKLRLVRILRSTVMVRVGGGWMALDEFLVKNDPCRAKGRTNVELREQFTLADGVSQSMTPFRSRSAASPNSSASRGQASSQSYSSNMGPITKIRQKSERSLPMVGTSRSSFSDVSAYDNQSPGYSNSGRRQSGYQRNGSNGNNSRLGSNVSLDESDDYSFNTRGSVRRSSSLRRSQLRLGTPVGFGSSTPRISASGSQRYNMSSDSRNSSVERY